MKYNHPMKQPRIAIATEFLEQHGGAQKVLEAIAEIYPEAPIYTAKFNRKALTPFLEKREIIYPKNKWVNILAKHFFVFAMAPIFENYDFRKYDIVISDGTTWTKGIITNPNQLHITYIHTPPRFFYGYSKEGNKWDKGIWKIPFSYMLNILRLWDFVAAQRPDYIIANSKEVQKRVQRFYRKDSTVIYPPVDISMDTTKVDVKFKEYYLALGRLSKYKNFDKVIEAFNKTDLNLVILGTGFEEKKLMELARNNIQFVGKLNDSQKHYLLENCLGVINAVEDEDFGIVPIEAHAHGKPVLAHRSGGHKETVKEGVSGMFFDTLTEKEVLEFDKDIKSNKYNNEKIKATTPKYAKERFQKEIKEFVDNKWKEFNTNNA